MWVEYTLPPRCSRAQLPIVPINHVLIVTFRYECAVASAPVMSDDTDIYSINNHNRICTVYLRANLRIYRMDAAKQEPIEGLAKFPLSRGQCQSNWKSSEKVYNMVSPSNRGSFAFLRDLFLPIASVLFPFIETQMQQTHSFAPRLKLKATQLI